MIKKLLSSRKVISSLLAGFLLIAVIVFSLPSLLSTEWGKNRLLALTNYFIPGSIEIKDVQLSWFGPQIAKNIHLKDPSGNIVASVSDFSTDATLIELLRQKINQGFVKIDGLSADIVEVQPGITNLQHALIKNIAIHSNSSKIANPIHISVTNVNAKLHASSPTEPMTIHLKGQTKQDDLTGSFDVNIVLKGVNRDKWHQISDNGEVTLHTDIKSFPVALIDQLIALKKPPLSGMATAMFGKTLNLVTHSTIAQSNLLFALQANSTNLTTNLDGKVESGKLEFKNAGKISFIITPELVKQLASLKVTANHITLLKPAKAELAIQELSMPIGLSVQEMLSEVYLKAQLNVDQAEFNTPHLESSLELRQMQANVQIPLNGKTILTQLQGDLIHLGRTMHLNLSATSEKPSEEQELFTVLPSNSELKVELNNLPLPIVDKFLNLKNSLVSSLGQQANLMIQAKSSEKQTTFSFALNSDRLTLPLTQLRFDRALTLEQPITLQYRLDPTILSLIDINRPNLQLHSDSMAQIRLEKFSMPLSDLSEFAKDPISTLKQTSLRTIISLASLTIKDQKLGTVVTNDIQADIQGENFADLQYQLSMNLEAQEQDQLIAAIGNSGRLVINAKEDQFRADWTSSLAKASVKGVLTSEGIFTMLEPMTLAYTLTPHSAQLLGLTVNNTLQLDQPATLHLVVDPIKAPINLKELSDFKKANLQMAGQISVNELFFSKRNTESSQAVIRNLNLPWQLNSQNNQIKIAVQATTQIGGNHNGSLQGKIDISNWVNLSSAVVETDLQFKNLPVIFIEVLAQKNNLVNFLGSTIDMELVASTANSHAINISFQGDQIKGKAAIAFGNAIELQNQNQPATIDFTITPERFRLLRQYLSKKFKNSNPDPFTLASHATFHADISSLHVPLKTAGEWTQAALKAKVEINNLEIIDAQIKQNFSLEKITADIDTQNLAKHIHFNIFANQDVSSKEDNETTIEGTLENAFTSSGELNRSDLSLQFEAKSRRLPAGLISHLIYKDPSIRHKVEAMFGPTVDTDVKISLQRMSGPIQANFKGKNGHMTLDSSLSQGVLTLKRPLEIEVAVTPQLSKSILQDFVPILSGAIAAERPIKITVDPQQFQFPIQEFDIEDIKIGRASIDLGKIQFTNEGELGDVFALLKPTTHDALSVWFTPLFIDLEHGILRLYRMDMLLLNKYPIALWGKINFPKDNVDLTIAITGTALSYALGLHDLEQNYMMQLPFKGSIGSASIDKAKATTRISALVAQTQGGPHGVILGTVLDIAGGSLAERTPPEPTSPLPWDTTTADNGNNKPQKPHHKSESNDPAKLIEQGAKTLINSFFK